MTISIGQILYNDANDIIIRRAKRFIYIYFFFASYATGFPSRVGSVMYSVGPFCTALNVEQCRKELMTNYRTSLCMIQLVPWDPKSHVDMNTVFTDVCMILEDTATATKQRILLAGSYNDILSANVNNAKPLRILIEGKAGSGKTTLMSKLAYDWMEGKKDSPLGDIELLFCLQLRFLNQDDDFGDAVVEFLLPEDTSVTAPQIEEYVKAHPDKALVVLDGYDEFHSDIHGIKGIGNILRILENKRMTRCPVIVTSRPWRAADFKDQNLAKHYVHMTVEGFSKNNVDDFIRKYFQDHVELSEHLTSYLKDNPAVQTVTQFPLFCAMLCQVWKDAEEENREKLHNIVTLSKLFDHIFSYLWGHYHKKQVTGGKKEKAPEKRLTLTRKSLRSSSKHENVDMLSCLKRLGRIALEGLISPEKKLQFTEEDFKKCPEMLHLACDVGLLSRQRSRPTGNRTTIRLDSKVNESVVFFHKLAQEKCAGLYLSSMCTTQPKKFVRTLKDVYILTKANEFRYVLQFACGEDLYTAKKILRHMATITPYQKLALECNFESQSGPKSFKRLSKFFTTERLFMTGKPSTYSYNALEYYLKHSLVLLRPGELPSNFTYFATDGLSPPQLRNLTNVLNLPQFQFMIQFNMEHSSLDGPDVGDLIESLSQKMFLGVLGMSRCTAGEEFVHSLLAIPKDGLEAMLMLYLPVLNSKWAKEVLLKLPAICPKLAALEATFQQEENVCDEPSINSVENEHDLKEEVEAKSQGETEEQSECCPFDELVTLSLRGCTLCKKCSLQMAKTLSLATQLEKLHLAEPSLHQSFYSNLACLESLREFSVKEYTFGQFHLDEFLSKCPILEDLYVEAKGREHKDVNGVVRALAKSTAHTPMLTSITLWFPENSGNKIAIPLVEDVVFSEFFDAILKCSHLSKLLLWHVPLGTDMAMDLLEACKKHRTLNMIR